jgi:hypothetical protein
LKFCELTLKADLTEEMKDKERMKRLNVHGELGDGEMGDHKREKDENFKAEDRVRVK